MQYATLRNGVKMPMLGLGVYKTDDLEEMKRAIAYAWDAGYRSFDTAQMYGNEEMLGKALVDLGQSRESFFLTSKVDLCNMHYEKVKSSLQMTLQKLQTDYLDLFLVHWPGQQKDRLLHVWTAMEELYEEGKVRAIGVCNCESKHIQWLEEAAKVLPMVNQVERSPLCNDVELQSYCQERKILMEAWAPLLRGNFHLPAIMQLAKKYGKTPAQIVLRWDIQDGYIVIPKSVHKERILENADIFDFVLQQEDMALLNGLDERKRSSHDPQVFDF